MQQQSESHTGAALTIGQRLELGYDPSSPMGRRAEATEWLPSRLEDKAEDGRWFTVAWPTDPYRKLILVEPGDRVALAASSPRDALYAADAVIEAINHEPIPLLTVRIDGAWRRSQRRNAVRVGVAIRPRLADKVLGTAHKALRLGISNISASGVQVRSQDELHSGDLLELAFELLGFEGEVTVQARVRRVYRHDRDSTSRGIWDAGCEFEGVPDRVGQRIVQYIFAQQRALARLRKD
ncbi:MAG TPA: PilZ domain-containing protein [Chloroflexota bacterium]|nr:PilZ domain-containing protein [Chloroflexota bacterium]